MSTTGIVFGKVTYDKGAERTIERVREIAPYVDYCVLVCDDQRPYTQEQQRELSEFGNVIYLEKPFEDNMPRFRNHFVEESLRLKQKEGWENLWLVTTDSDEVLSEELRKEIRNVVNRAERNGVTVIGVNCQEQFDAMEWTDDLDVLKQIPKKSRSSSHFKEIIYKVCCGEFRFRGVGQTGNLHETWGCPQHPAVPSNLGETDRFYYTQRKSAYEVWRNASRNMFISGGGDNVGDLNPRWTELKRICQDLGIRNWKEMEEFVEDESKELPQQLVDWIKGSLRYSASNWGIETRQFCKWVIFHNRSLLEDPDIKWKAENPPELSEDDKLELEIKQHYFDVLKRPPDREGLDHYKGLVKQGKLDRKDVPEVLKRSTEYQQKFAEKVPLQVPVDVNISVDERTYIRAFMQSNLFRKTFKPRWDVGRLIEQLVDNSQEFYREFYERINLGEFSLDNLIELLQKYGKEG